MVKGDSMKALEVKNLVKCYKNKIAVDSITFDVDEGMLFAFLGENGAGKSTTINMLTTISKMTSGEVNIFGYKLGIDDDKIRDIIGICFQGSCLDPVLTVKENLLSRASFYELSKKEAIKRLEPFFKSLELNEIWNQKYKTLSGGERRRVDIARALINNPKILFLDEPTTGLDPKSRKIVWNYINELRRNNHLTIFLTTHYMEEVIDADRVVILDHGKIIENDTPANLKTKYTSTRLYWYINRDDKYDLLINKYDYHYEVDHYIINMTNNEIRNFIYQNNIDDFEVYKGSMDDVFLNLTGRELEV